MKYAKTLMIQGTASSVGKSILVAALCRIFRQEGYRTTPFKAQNMALNSFVTKEGGEIGRAQAVQAEAAGIEPTVDMNPVLLKPVTDSGCQIIVLGKAVRTISARDYYNYTPSLLATIKASLKRLRAAYDIVIIEGAGSPAEINLRAREIANMRIARLSRSPVLLVGDIDRGGVFASLLGTLELLRPKERELIRGLIINKFRGDQSLLTPGLKFLEKRAHTPVLGVIPYFRDIRIAQEDSVYLDERGDSQANTDLDIVVIRLPHVSNYDDFDPLEEEDCRLRYITQRFEFGNPHLIILPGTKSTVNDLKYLQQTGLADSIISQAKKGTPVVGICGGYQMLGQKILDPDAVESDNPEIKGLELLDVDTVFNQDKYTRQIKARVNTSYGLLSGAKGLEITGYEIHMGQTICREKVPSFQIFETPQGDADYLDGALNAKGNVLGTYMHGLFYNNDFRHAFLKSVRLINNLPAENHTSSLNKEAPYDKLAKLVGANLDISKIREIIGL
jgi:adenosylcobyric acid synthase